MEDRVMSKNGLWITWESQTRNIGLSNAVGFRLCEFIYEGRMVSRYMKCCWSTLAVLRKERPSVVVAQNPSILLATMVVLLRPLLGFTAVIDAHNSGIFPAEGRLKFLMLWAGWLQRKADLTIVTNNNLKRYVEKNGGLSIVLQDAIPLAPANVQQMNLKGKTTIAFICTFASDEPYNEVFEAAKLLSEDVVFYVTGRYDGKVDRSSVPANVILMGYLSVSEYWSLLVSVDFVMDLTLREDCLVCGAYEGVAVSKPLLLSDTKVLRKYFYKGCVWVSSFPQSIADGVNDGIRNQELLFIEIKELKHELPIKWNENVKLFIRKFR